MNVSDVATLLAVAAIALGSIVAAAIVLWALGRVWSPAERAWSTVVVSVGDQARWIAWGMAVVATAGSLYFSEIANFVPCTYCWYQRIAMYPVAAILLIAAITRDERAVRYVIPIAVIGLGLSIYHYQLQLFPEQATACSSGVPCNAKYVEEFGFVSIPFMAGCGFIAVIALQVAMLRARAVED